MQVKTDRHTDRSRPPAWHTVALALVVRELNEDTNIERVCTMAVATAIPTRGERPLIAHPSGSTQPTCLLVATDLGARCDRAVDRAAQLARQWQAELIALNVLDVTSAPDQAMAWAAGKSDEQALQVAWQQLARDLSGLDVRATMRIARSRDAARTIRELAASNDCSLVVVGLACNEIDRLLRSSTVERLVRSLHLPLLAVRQRAHRPYRRIVVATDFSAPSRQALETAARFFPGCELVLYHARQTAHSATLDKRLDPPGGDVEQDIRARFPAMGELPVDVTLRPVIEHGALETALTQYVRKNDIDLVVMGTRGRGMAMSILLGSHAAKLLNWLPCDVLVVREAGVSA